MSARFSLVLLGVILAACSHAPAEYQVVHADHGKVRIPERLVADGEVHFFSFVQEGTRVNFLVRTDARGGLHTHFDACHSCYRYKRGFVVEDDALVCVACRYTYAIADEEWDFIGACAPISFHFERENGELVVDLGVFDKGRRFF